MLPRPSLGRRVASGAAWITLEVMVLQVFSLLVFAVLARLLTPTEFGLASIAFVLVSSAKIVLVDSIASIVARKAAGTDAEYSTAFWLSVAVCAAAFAAIQLASLAVDGWFGTRGLGDVLRVMALVLPAQGIVRTQEVWLQRHFHYRTLAARSVVGALAGGVAGVAGALAGMGAAALAVQQVVAAAVAFVLLWWGCPWRPGLVFSRPAARETLGFFVSTGGSSLAYAFSHSFDTVLIGAVFGPASAGVYNVAKRLRFAVQSVVATPVNGVTGPALAEVQGDPPRFLSILLTAVTVAAALCGPVFLGGAAVGTDLVLLVFGPRWVDAVPAFQWLAVGGLCAVLLDMNGNVFLIRGRPRLTLFLALGNIALTLAAFAVVQRVRPDLVAAPFVLPYLVLAPVSVWLLLRVTGLSLRRWAAAALLPLLAAGVMAGCVLALRPVLAGLDLPLRLAASVGAGVLVYAATAALVLRRPLAEFVGMVRHRRRTTG